MALDLFEGLILMHPAHILSSAAVRLLEKNSLCLLVSYRTLAQDSQFGFWGRGGLLRASVDVSLLPVVEACVVVAVPGRVGDVRVNTRLVN